MDNTVSVVVPAYRSAGVLPELVSRLIPILKGISSVFEILLVEDASPDEGKTWNVVKDLAASHPEVRGFRLLRNRGQHNALLLGIREARYDIVVTIDDDLQTPPEEVPVLIAALRGNDADVIYGVPREKAHGVLQNLGSFFVGFALAMVLGSIHPRSASSFRAFKTVLRTAFADHRSARVSIDALLGWGTTRFGNVEVEHRPRAAGQSGYSFFKLVSHALTMITSYSTVPLRAASLIGLLLMLLGIGVFVYVLLGKLIGYVTLPGFTFLVSLFALIGGSQLLALGVIGEYVATIFLRSTAMPAYTLAERTDAKPDYTG